MRLLPTANKRDKRRAYLAAFDAWLAAGGKKAPPFTKALKDESLRALENGRGLCALVGREPREGF
jgi:hypothetical protein